MDALSLVLPILLSILGCVLLVVLIILGIKLIQMVNKANDVIVDLEKKTQSLNALFNVIDNVTDAISLVGDRVVEGVVGFVTKLFKKNKRKKIKEEENEDE